MKYYICMPALIILYSYTHILESLPVLFLSLVFHSKAWWRSSCSIKAQRVKSIHPRKVSRFCLCEASSMPSSCDKSLQGQNMQQHQAYSDARFAPRWGSRMSFVDSHVVMDAGCHDCLGWASNEICELISKKKGKFSSGWQSAIRMMR